MRQEFNFKDSLLDSDEWNFQKLEQNKTVGNINYNVKSINFVVQQLHQTIKKTKKILKQTLKIMEFNWNHKKLLAIDIIKTKLLKIVKSC